MGLYHGTILWNCIEELDYGIMLQDYIREIHYVIILWNHITGLYQRIILRDFIEGLDYRMMSQNHITKLHYGFLDFEASNHGSEALNDGLEPVLTIVF